MAKCILICGSICSGKTSYSKKLLLTRTAVPLSADELVSALFHPHENDFHDQIIQEVHSYLIDKSLDILKTGTSVIFDWGFWTKAERRNISDFYRSKKIETEWHYLNVCIESRKRNIEKRNRDVLAGYTTDYYVDEGLFYKAERLFEAPDRDEIDIWIDC